MSDRCPYWTRHYSCHSFVRLIYCRAFFRTGNRVHVVICLMHFPLRELAFVFIGTLTSERKGDGKRELCKLCGQEVHGTAVFYNVSFPLSFTTEFQHLKYIFLPSDLTICVVILIRLPIFSFCVNLNDTTKWWAISLLSGMVSYSNIISSVTRQRIIRP